MAKPTLSIVVAVRDGGDNFPALLDAVKDRRDDCEVILCCAGSVPAAVTAGASAYSFPTDTLVPFLWSEGIKLAKGRGVALTTAQFIPDSDWLARLHAANLNRWAGIGGAIENDPNSSARNWAIFFLRYSAFAPPLPAGETNEIAADNAIYDRAAIMEHPDLLDEGFWEPSFHRRFHAAGRRLSIDPGLTVVHHGTVSAESFAHQRYLHGRAYGIERTERAGLGRSLLLLVSSPVVPPLLLARIVSRIARRPRYRSKLWVAFPWLIRFTLAWATGEAAGYASTLVRRLRSGAAGPSKGHA